MCIYLIGKCCCCCCFLGTDTECRRAHDYIRLLQRLWAQMEGKDVYRARRGRERGRGLAKVSNCLIELLFVLLTLHEFWISKLLPLLLEILEDPDDSGDDDDDDYYDDNGHIPIWMPLIA